jgi:hypothetical protein
VSRLSAVKIHSYSSQDTRRYLDCNAMNAVKGRTH